MKHCRSLSISFVLVTLALVLVGALPWPPIAAPHSAVAAQRPTVPLAPTEGRPRPTLPPTSCHTPGTASGCAEPSHEPEVCLRLSGTLANATAPATISYILWAQNNGRGQATGVPVRLPLAPSLVTLQGVSFSSPDGWTSSVLSDGLELQLGPLAPGAAVSATIRLVTLPSALPDTLLTARAYLISHGEAESRSNSVVLTEGQPGGEGSAPLALVPPSGTAGTMFQASYDGFASDEHVGVWYHRPDGSVIALDGLRADGQGRVALTVASSGLPVGRYQLVAQGQCSQATATGTLIIEGP